MVENVQCPGCHIGCSLTAPQCGRGLGFAEKLANGEELPPRRIPGGPMGGAGKPGPGGSGGPGPKGGRPKPSGPMRDNHLVMLLTKIMPNVLGSVEGLEADEPTNILTWLLRQEGKMTKAIMPERARATKETLDATLAALVENGLVEVVSVNGAEFYAITEAGKAQVEDQNLIQQTAVAKALAPLADDERQTIVELCHKLLEANRKAR